MVIVESVAIAKPDAGVTREDGNGAVTNGPMARTVSTTTAAIVQWKEIFVFAFGSEEMIVPWVRLVPWIRDDAPKRFVGAP